MKLNDNDWVIIDNTSKDELDIHAISGAIKRDDREMLFDLAKQGNHSSIKLDNQMTLNEWKESAKKLNGDEMVFLPIKTKKVYGSYTQAAVENTQSILTNAYNMMPSISGWTGYVFGNANQTKNLTK